MTEHVENPAESPPHPFRIVEGDRARLEAQIVEDLFLDRYDPAKAARLQPAGRLVLVRPGEETTGKVAG